MHAPPPAKDVARCLRAAHERFLSNREGRNADTYPTLAAAPVGHFGLCFAEPDGRLHTAGDWQHPFALMSVSKPFVFALACEVHGERAVRARIGVNATGLPFNALEAIEAGTDGRTNPMVNPGALATAALSPGDTQSARWRFLHQGLSRFAGRTLAEDHALYELAVATNVRNREIAERLEARGALLLSAAQAVELYTRQCVLQVNAQDLAVMGATLAGGGVNPVTGERVVSRDACRASLAVMAAAGFYEQSGDWLCEVGVPGKSGIAGGLVMAAPGKGALGSFSSRLDASGTSVRGRLAARFVSEGLGLGLFTAGD